MEEDLNCKLSKLMQSVGKEVDEHTQKRLDPVFSIIKMIVYLGFFAVVLILGVIVYGMNLNSKDFGDVLNISKQQSQQVQVVKYIRIPKIVEVPVEVPVEKIVYRDRIVYRDVEPVEHVKPIKCKTSFDLSTYTLTRTKRTETSIYKYYIKDSADKVEYYTVAVPIAVAVKLPIKTKVIDDCKKTSNNVQR